MFSNKREGRIVVIEVDISPATGCMAGTAIGPELSVVVVIGSMAGIAIGWRALINTIGMAVATSEIAMLSYQGEARI